MQFSPMGGGTGEESLGWGGAAWRGRGGDGSPAVRVSTVILWSPACPPWPPELPRPRVWALALDGSPPALLPDVSEGAASLPAHAPQEWTPRVWPAGLWFCWTPGFVGAAWEGRAPPPRRGESPRPTVGHVACVSGHSHSNTQADTARVSDSPGPLRPRPPPPDGPAPGLDPPPDLTRHLQGTPSSRQRPQAGGRTPLNGPPLLPPRLPWARPRRPLVPSVGSPWPFGPGSACRALWSPSGGSWPSTPAVLSACGTRAAVSRGLGGEWGRFVSMAFPRSQPSRVHGAPLPPLRTGAWGSPGPHGL